MKCDKHPDRDAIGTCVSCGRGICQDCKVSLNNMFHCKACVESGNVSGGQQQAPQAWGAQGHQYQHQQYPYPYSYQYANPYQTQFKEEVPIENWYGNKKPSPTGTPNRGLFTKGAMGCVTAAIAAAIMSVNYAFGILQWGLPIISIILFGMTIPFLIGLFGFYRNYGSTICIGSAVTLAICQVAFIIFAIYAQLGDWSYPDLYVYDMPEWYPMGYAFIGTGYLLVGIAMHQAKAYIYPMTDPRAMNHMSSFGLLTTSVLFYVTAGAFQTPGCVWSLISMSGWIVLAFSLFGYMRTFNDAPVPIMGPKEEPAEAGIDFGGQ